MHRSVAQKHPPAAKAGETGTPEGRTALLRVSSFPAHNASAQTPNCHWHHKQLQNAPPFDSLTHSKMEPSSELLGILKRRRSLNGELTQSPAQRYYVNDHLADLLSRSQYEMRRGLFATNAYRMADLCLNEQIEIQSPVPFPKLPNLTPAHKLMKKAPDEEPEEMHESKEDGTVRKRRDSAVEAETDWLVLTAHWHCSSIIAVDRDHADALDSIFARVDLVMLTCRVHQGSGGQGLDFGAFPGYPLNEIQDHHGADDPDLTLDHIALGDSLLHLAAKNGRTACTLKLLELGADVAAYNSAGKTARVQATVECREVFAAFFKQKAAVTATAEKQPKRKAAEVEGSANSSGGHTPLAIPLGWEVVPLPAQWSPNSHRLTPQLTAQFFKGLHVLVNDGVETRWGKVDRMLKRGKSKGMCKVFWEGVAVDPEGDVVPLDMDLNRDPTVQQGSSTGYDIDLCHLRYGDGGSSVEESKTANGSLIAANDQRQWVGIRQQWQAGSKEKDSVGGSADEGGSCSSSSSSSSTGGGEEESGGCDRGEGEAPVRHRAVSISSALANALEHKTSLQMSCARYEVGDTVEVLSGTNMLRCCTVVNQDQELGLKVHYDGFDAQYDEWISLTSSRISGKEQQREGSEAADGVALWTAPEDATALDTAPQIGDTTPFSCTAVHEDDVHEVVVPTNRQRASTVDLQQALKEWCALDMENMMIRWLKGSSDGDQSYSANYHENYAHFIACEFPENIRLGPSGEVEWMDERVVHPEWSGTFERLSAEMDDDPDYGLHPLGDIPPMTPLEAIEFIRQQEEVRFERQKRKQIAEENVEEYWGSGASESESNCESESECENGAASGMGSPLDLSVSQPFDEGDGENYSAV
jgi:hypothetical protein